MPVNLLQIEAEYDNIRYYLGMLYDQLDMFEDFIMFAINNPGGMTIADYMGYLDEVSDINDIEGRLRGLEEMFDEALKEAGVDSEEL